MPAGRPTKYNWEELEPLMDKAIDEGMYIEELANYLDIDGNTLRAWEAEHPEFFRSVKKVRESCQRRIAKLLDAHAYGGIEKGRNLRKSAGEVAGTTLRCAEAARNEGEEPAADD